MTRWVPAIARANTGISINEQCTQAAVILEARRRARGRGCRVNWYPPPGPVDPQGQFGGVTCSHDCMEARVLHRGPWTIHGGAPTDPRLHALIRSPWHSHPMSANNVGKPTYM